jgi:putative inorganic carbon (hco3(-)) transporter
VALRDLVVTAFFLLSLPVCFMRPFYGILLWTVIAFLNPQSFTWSASNSLALAQMVAIPTLAGFLCFVRGWEALNCREVILIGVLWIWFGITSIVSADTALFVHHSHETWERWSFVSKVLLMVIVSIPIVNSFDRLRILVIVIAGCFGFFVAKAFPFVIATGGAHRLYGPENSMIADNNDFGLALNMTLPLFFFLAQTESKPWMKRVFVVLFAITIPSILFTYSRGAMVGMLVVTLLMFVQLRQRLLLVPAIILTALLALLFAPDSWKRRMDPANNETLDASAKARLNSWAFARNLAADYPITGGGFSTFTPELFDRYAPEPKNFHGPHSVYFQLLGEHGYVGLLLYLTLAACCFATTHRLVKEARRRDDITIVHYANMFRFSLVGFLTSGVFLGRAYFDYFFTIVACLVILKKIAYQDWAYQDGVEEAEAEPDGDNMTDSWDRELWAR